MRELGIDLGVVREYFAEIQNGPYLFVRVPADKIGEWTDLLGVPARRCYITDANLAASAARVGKTEAEVLAQVLPEPGPVMSGDYGELMTAVYLASQELPAEVLEPKMWRLKSNRLKASEGSDIVQLYLPTWPAPSSDDRLMCAEVKTKATNGDSTPVPSALQDSRKDMEGRLAKTLLWLRARAHTTDLGTVELGHLERFINATDHPKATFAYRAVAVISSELVGTEVVGIDATVLDNWALVVISVPELKKNYEALFEAVLETASTAGTGS